MSGEKRELAELPECARARELAEKHGGEVAEALNALADKTERFQRLWIDTVDAVRESEVGPLASELDRLRGLLATDSVERMEEALKQHYGDVVLPAREYCDAFRSWADVIRIKLRDEELDDGERARWEAVIAAFNSLQLPIGKSNLLARLIYNREPLRTQPCPIHKGRWSGYAMGAPCLHGCNLGWADITGWLPGTVLGTRHG
jgi:hypothetical protein